jgi:hypothetical protein
LERKIYIREKNKDMKLNMLLFADDQVIIYNSEDNLQRGLCFSPNRTKIWNKDFNPENQNHGVEIMKKKYIYILEQAKISTYWIVTFHIKRGHRFQNHIFFYKY